MTERPAQAPPAAWHRMPRLRLRWGQALALGGATLLSSACVTRTVETPQIAASPTAVVRSTTSPTATATRRVSPEATATRPVRSTATETATPSATPGVAIDWKVPAVEVQPWPETVFWMRWTSLADIEIAANPDLIVHQEGLTLTLSTVTPAPTVSVPDTRVSGSWNAKWAYLLDCAAGEVWLTEASTGQILGRTTTESGHCPEGFSGMTLSPDRTALAFVDYEGSVWVWELGTTEPRQVATTTFPWQEANWSPDSQDLVVMAYIPGSADAYTYMIAHRDGRPATRTNAELSTRSERTPIWQSDTVLRHYSQCGATCSGYSFYEAYTGRFLTGFGTESGDPQAPDSPLSPDGHWLITSPDSGGDMIVWNLQTLHTFTLTPEPGRAYQQVGWTPDSSMDFLIERATLSCPCGPDDRDPGELLVLDPVAQTFSSVAPQVLFASLSPTGERLWIVTENEAGTLEGMLVDRSGQPLSAPQNLGSLHDLVADWDSNPQVQAFGKPFTVAWSPSGQRALVTDWQRGLWYLSRTPSLQLLTDAWLTPRVFWDWKAEWSPDETAVMITSQDRGWLIGPLEAP